MTEEMKMLCLGCDKAISEIEAGIDLKTEDGRTVFGNLLIHYGLISGTIECRNSEMGDPTIVIEKITKLGELLDTIFAKFQKEGI